jgi:hypothetical protein
MGARSTMFYIDTPCGPEVPLGLRFRAAQTIPVFVALRESPFARAQLLRIDSRRERHVG